MWHLIGISLFAMIVTLTGCKNARMTVIDPQSDQDPTTTSEEEKGDSYYNPAPIKEGHEIRPEPRPIDFNDNSGTEVIIPPLPIDESPIGPIGKCGDGPECTELPPQRKECKPVDLDTKLDQPKLDILFVVDTSASLRGGKNKGTGGELGQLGRDMRYFVNRLDKDTDLRIGMILGHGPASTQYHGRLYSNGPSDPAVLDLATLIQVERQKNTSLTLEQAREIALTNIGKSLEARMIQMPAESRGAQGEALMLSLYDSIKNPSLLSEIRNQGLYRKNVPLAVIMISDEQDVCFDYAGSGASPRLVSVKNSKGKIVKIPDPIETAFFNSSACQNAVNGNTLLKPGHVYDALKELTNDKLIMTSVVYMNNNVPQGVEDENEMGHGFLELTQLAGGLVADLAQVDRESPTFWAQMDNLGKFADFKMRFTNEFPCASNVNPATIDPASVEVRVLNESDKEIAVFTGECRGRSNCSSIVAGPAVWKIERDGKGNLPYGKVAVSSSVLGDLLKKNNYSKGTVKMSFKEKQN